MVNYFQLLSIANVFQPKELSKELDTYSFLNKYRFSYAMLDTSYTWIFI